MKLRAIRLHNVRQFGGHGVAVESIADGLNSFAEPNETGKSTIFDALQELLFKKHSSKDGQVRSLQPYGGGNPHIEAALELDGQLFRIEKRFIAGPALARVLELSSGQEIARQDVVQDWITETLSLGDQGAGPAGLLWVRQGRSWHQGGGSAARGATLSDIVAEQLDAVTAGERMRGIMERTTSELDPLITANGNPRSGGAYAIAIEEVDTLTAEVQELSDRHANLLRDLKERQRLERDVETRRADSEENDRLKTRLTEAEDKLTKSASDAARLPELKRQLAAAEKIRSDARDKLERFFEARNKARMLQGQIVKRETHLPGLQSAQEDARTTLAVASEHKMAAEETAQRAEKAWQASLTEQRRQERETQLIELKATERKAKTAAQNALDKRAEASLSIIDSAMLDRIEAAARQLETGKAQAAASVTSVEIDYLPDQSGRVRIDGEPLPDGAQQDIASRQTLEVDGVGSITVVPGGLDRAIDAAEHVSKAAEALDVLLSEAGVDGPAPAREAFRRKEELLREATGQTEILKTLVPDGIDALSEKVAGLTLEVQTAVDHQEIEPDAARGALEKAKEDHRAANAALNLARENLTTATDAVRDGSEDIKNLKTLLEAEVSTTGPQLQWEARSKDLALQLANAEQNLSAIQQTLLQLEGTEERHAFAKAEVDRLRQAERNRTDERHRIELRLEAIKQRFNNATDEGLTEALQGARDILEAAHCRRDQIELRVQALKCLDRALKAAHRAMREAYFEPVNAELRPLLDRVLRGQTLVFDDASFEPQKLQRDERQEDIERLSGGTQKQIAILTRLAFARLMARNGRPTPVILDDALIFTDDDRIEDMFTILNSMTKDLQILVLTCRQRAFRSMGGNILSLSDWRPEDE